MLKEFAPNWRPHNRMLIRTSLAAQGGLGSLAKSPLERNEFSANVFCGAVQNRNAARHSETGFSSIARIEKES
jgi:hypothetical protein